MSGKTRDISFRIRQLENLLRMYEENEADFITALYKDLRKPKYEAKLVEIEVLKGDVRTMIENCKEWSKPQRVCILFLKCAKCTWQLLFSLRLTRGFLRLFTPRYRNHLLP